MLDKIPLFHIAKEKNSSKFMKKDIKWRHSEQIENVCDFEHQMDKVISAALTVACRN